MNEIVLYGADKHGFDKAFDYCKKWSAEHQAEVGVAEMALGAAIITWGLHSGLINIGTDVVGTKLTDGGLIGGITGSGIGGIGASILGSIGVAGAFTFGIPAVILAGGGTLILGAAGYGIGDLAQKLLTTPSGFGDFLAGASILTIGVALMIDGAGRVVKDDRVLKMASKFKDGVIQLAPLTAEIVAKTREELQAIIKNMDEHPNAKDAVLGTTTGITTAVGAGIGGGLAASTVTVAGSHALGSAAIALGLVSAPVWPIIAGGAAGLAVGLAAWKGVQHYRNKHSVDSWKEPQHGGSLPNPDNN